MEQQPMWDFSATDEAAQHAADVDLWHDRLGHTPPDCPCGAVATDHGAADAVPAIYATF